MSVASMVNPRTHGPMKMTTITAPPRPPRPQPPSDADADNERSSCELRALDCNLNSLCDHIQMEGFNSGAFSDIVVRVMGSTYHLHRLILSRSSYFRHMLQGPWKEASEQTVTLHVDDNNVDGDAIAMALAYLYGHHPQLKDSNAFRVLAAASFLDLQDLCTICTDFIVSELWTSNFLEYQIFAERQDYGIHGERVRDACWGYLCQSSAMELKDILPRLSSQTLHALLNSSELWVPSEEKRFELALYTLLAKSSFCKSEHDQESSNLERESGSHSDFSKGKGNSLIDGSANKLRKTELGWVGSEDGLDGHSTAHNVLNELADCVLDFHTGISDSEQQKQQSDRTQSDLEPSYSCKMELPSPSCSSFFNTDRMRSSCSYVEVPLGVQATGLGNNGVAIEGPSEEGSCSCDGPMSNEWGRCGLSPLSWGGRIVGRRPVKGYAIGVRDEEYTTFLDIFEGGSFLYCNMSFESLINVRKQLEELGFPCKAVNDGLWLQMLLNQRVQEIGADTCTNCCLTSVACTCKRTASGYCMQVHDQSRHGNMENIYVGDSAQGQGNGLFRAERMPVRGAMDGLAGIGRGPTNVSAAAWPPTRLVYTRVPFGIGNRNCQQSLGNDDLEVRADHSGDGLTALVGLSQGGDSIPTVSRDQRETGYDTGLQSRLTGASLAGSSTGCVPMQALDAPGHAIEWDKANSSFISLDLKTPLTYFSPFRFGVEFEDVHRLSDGQSKPSGEVYYAGSLWKVSVQGFYDEDPQGRRTIGLFLHRKKGDITDALRKVRMFVDHREKVNVRFQLICPSKREVKVFASNKTGTLLPKSPKGWGWRSALLFDELSDYLQNGALRVVAIVQLV